MNNLNQTESAVFQLRMFTLLPKDTLFIVFRHWRSILATIAGCELKYSLSLSHSLSLSLSLSLWLDLREIVLIGKGVRKRDSTAFTESLSF